VREYRGDYPQDYCAENTHTHTSHTYRGDYPQDYCAENTHTHTSHTYRGDYPQDYGAENKRLVKDHIYLTSEVEPVFDAADVMRFGNLNFVP
jgi:hypothetical protein